MIRIGNGDSFIRKHVGKIRRSFLLPHLAVVGAASALPAPAVQKPVRTARMGYYKGDNDFQDGPPDEERRSGYACEYYQAFSTLINWNYEYIYGPREEAMSQLLAGEANTIAGVYQTDKRSGQALFLRYNMGLRGEERCFTVNINRADLLNELNDVQDALLASMPDFMTLLRQRYYGSNLGIQVLINREKTWPNERGSPNIGYVKGILPLFDQTEDGAPTGVIKELVSLSSAYIKIPLNLICYDNMMLMETGLCDGEIDVTSPIYSDFWITESKGFFQTDAFLGDRVMTVHEGGYRGDLMDKITLIETGVGQRYYISIYYSSSKTIYYATKADSIAATKRDEVDHMIDCSSTFQRYFMEHVGYEDLSTAYLDTSESFDIAVSQGESILVEILNKTIRRMDNTVLASTMVQYSNVEVSYTFIGFTRHYSIGIIVVLRVSFSILLRMYISLRRKTKLFDEEQAKTRAVLEDALRATNAASDAKTPSLSSMSHDIRTPLNGIIGVTAIAGTHTGDPSRVQDCLIKVTSSGKHLLTLINEVLGMVKIESGEVRLNEGLLDLSALIDDLITTNKSQSDTRQQNLVVHILNISHEKIIGDSLRLQQVFTNLVNNAIKYTPAGGEIEVTPSEKPSGSPKLRRFELMVQDNGIGMSEDYLPHAFETFTRVDNASAIHVQGTGLRLATVHNIVHMMNGDIIAESTLGQGLKLTVTLLMKLQDTEDIPYEDFMDLNILVVDDDQIIRESTCILLSELGMEGEWVVSGRAAVDQVELRHNSGRDYFVVLLDWKMSDVDGIATAREIRRCVGDRVPIIVISAYDWSVIEKEARMAGANGFIGKPLLKSRLTHLFGRLLNHEMEENGPGLRELTGQTDFSGKRVLLAEDNKINVEITMEILSVLGLAAEWAHDSKETVDCMKTSPSGYYNRASVDVQVPMTSGSGAIKAIRNLPHPDAKAILIFVIAINAMAEDAETMLAAGMNEHIAELLGFRVLTDVLNKYLR